MISLRSVCLPLLVLLAGLPCAVAQNIPFQIQVQEAGQQAFAVQNGSTLDVIANAVGVPDTVTVTVTYAGASMTTVQIPSDAQITGSSDFTVSHILGLPLTLSPQSTFSVAVTFNPSTAQRSTAQLVIPFVLPPAASTAPPTTGTITLNFVGFAPSYSLSYALSTNGNVVSVANGGTLAFPATPVTTVASATIFVVNQGSGAGGVTSISLTGAAFRLVSTPLLPVALPAGNDVSFQIQYSPVQVGADAGSLTVTFSSGSITIQLAGSALLSNLSYVFVNGNTSATLLPGQAVVLPDVPVGQQSIFTIQAQNTSGTNTQLTLISVTGAGFALVDAPPLPVVLTPGAGFNVVFSTTPQQAGAFTGRVRIGADSFTFTENGLGPQLVYSFGAGGSFATVLAGGTMVFNPTAVGQFSSLQVNIQNTGTASTFISSVGVSGPAGVFKTQNLPVFPYSLTPGSALSFQLSFSPLTTGQTMGTLLINAQQFSVSGFGNAPPPVSGFELTGPSGSLSPFQQIPLSLSLSPAYPLPVKGKLALQVAPDSFSSDPAVQFSTGGQSTTFTIPANQTQAIFANGSTQVRLQTGTVSGRINVVPTFQTDPGAVDVTPDNAQSLQLVVPALAPVLLSSRLASSTPTSFSVSVTGYSTTRTLSSLAVQLTPTPGTSLTAGSSTIDISQVATLWFNSNASTTFGGQFTITIPFTLSSTDPIVSIAAFARIQSVSVKATNDIGTSATTTLTLH